MAQIFATTAPRTLFLIVFLLLTLGAAGCSWVGLVSVSTSGGKGNLSSSTSCLSGDGRYVAFESNATNLVAGEVGSYSDIFVYDTRDNVMTRVSVDSAGNPGNGNSIDCAISADGRYVAFSSVATNLVANDTNNQLDVFLHDRDTGTTSRVSLTNLGAEGNHISRDPSITADGRYVAFYSFASNLVTGDNFGHGDIFVRDLVAGTTTRVSVDTAGNEANDFSSEAHIAAEGRYVAFKSAATNLVANDNNNADDIFVHDRDTGATLRVSVDSGGSEGSFFSGLPSIAADGSAVAFWSSSTNLVGNDTNARNDIFVHELTTGVTTRVSVDSAGNEGNEHADEPVISSSGRFVIFSSVADNMVADDTNGGADVFLHDRLTGRTTRETLESDGTEILGGFPLMFPALSADERYLSYHSLAPVTGGPFNFFGDVYIRAIPPMTVTSISPNTVAIGAVTQVTISGTNFFNGAEPGIQQYITGFTRLNETTFLATVDVPVGESPGDYNVVVTHDGTGPGPARGVSAMCEACLTLQ